MTFYTCLIRLTTCFLRHWPNCCYLAHVSNVGIGGTDVTPDTGGHGVTDGLGVLGGGDLISLGLEENIVS